MFKMNRQNMMTAISILAIGSILVFQNCAKPKSGNERSADQSSQSNGGCNASQVPFQGQCLAKNQPCSTPNGTAQQTWDEVNLKYGECNATMCGLTFHLETPAPAVSTDPTVTVCSMDTKACVVAGGSGTQTWDPVGKVYGACAASTCTVAGTHLEGGACLPDNKACPIVNGTGIQTWNPAGMAYGACMVATCNVGFSKIGNVCSEQLNIVYRYFRGGAGHFWSTSATDPVPLNAGYGLEGGSWTVYNAPAAGRILIRSCAGQGQNYAHTTGCVNGVVLGYVTQAQEAGKAAFPLYYCISTLSGRPMTTKSANECGTAVPVILGFVF